MEVHVCHLASGAIWGGAEAQATALMGALAGCGRFRVHALLLNGGEMETRLRQAGVTVEVIPETGHGFPVLLARVSEALRRIRPHILHVHDHKTHLLAGLATVAAGRAPVVRTHHGIGMLGASRLHDMVERLCGKCFSSALVAVSSDLAGVLVERGFLREKIHVIRNGVDPEEIRFQGDRLSVRRELGVPESVLLAAFVGRLAPVKDPLLLLEAVHHARQGGVDVHALLVGDGPMREEILARSRALGLNGCIHLAGFRPDPWAVAAVADVFVMTSRHEGIPLALLEAMSLGQPVIVPEVGGLPEVVTEGREGFLVPPSSPEKLAEALCRLASSPEMGGGMGGRARATVRERFSISRMAKEMEDLYDIILDRRHGA